MVANETPFSRAKPATEQLTITTEMAQGTNPLTRRFAPPSPVGRERAGVRGRQASCAHPGLTALASGAHVEWSSGPRDERIAFQVKSQVPLRPAPGVLHADPRPLDNHHWLHRRWRCDIKIVAEQVVGVE